MKNLIYQNEVYNARELAEKTGVNYGTLCARLNRGYTVEEAVADTPRIPKSIIEFMRASHPPDWNGLSSYELFDIYVDWCLAHDYEPEAIVHLIRSLRRLLPNMKVIPSKIKAYGEVLSVRLVRIY